MEINYKLLFVFMFAAFLTLFVGIIIHGYMELIEEHDLELNASWDEGFVYGWDTHLMMIIERMNETGWMNLQMEIDDSGIQILSQEGCAAAFAAEIGNRGCEVVCAGQG